MTYNPADWTIVSDVADVTEEVLELVRGIESGWYSDSRIDWEDLWERLEGSALTDGTRIDLGSESNSPAMRKIQRTINAERRIS